MEARAIAKWVRMSPYKLRRVGNLVRGKDVNEALNILHFNSADASVPIEKTLRSAVANMLNKEEGSKLSPDDLFIKELRIDQGFALKRFRPAAMGRAMRIRKSTSHISIVVADRTNQI